MTKNTTTSADSKFTPSPAAQRQRLIPRIMLGLTVIILAGSAMAWLQSTRKLVVLETNPPDPLQTPVSDGHTPAPYEYDAASDRHWHPEHGHWHPGRPPSETSGTNLQTAAATNTPAHLYYDPETDKHWYAPHGHWHNGKPPEMTNAVEMTVTGMQAEATAEDITPTNTAPVADSEAPPATEDAEPAE